MSRFIIYIIIRRCFGSKYWEEKKKEHQAGPAVVTAAAAVAPPPQYQQNQKMQKVNPRANMYDDVEFPPPSA